jgi:hypothetical protein
MSVQWDENHSKLATLIESTIENKNSKEVENIRSFWNNEFTWKVIVSRYNSDGHKHRDWFSKGAKAYAQSKESKELSLLSSLVDF